MRTPFEHGAAYRSARRRVRQLRGFYAHLAIYLAVNAGLLSINLLASPERHWPAWPLAGWGVGLLIHGAVVALGGRFLGPEWESRKIRELTGHSLPTDR